MLRELVGTLAVLLPFAACAKEAPPPAAPPAQLKVAAASSLKELVEKAAPAFEQAHAPTKLIPSFEASSTLSRQIEAAAGYDAFLSADAANVDRLGDKVATATRVVFLGNELAVVAREGFAPMPQTADDLVALPGKLALAGEAVPAGKYARAWLTKKGLLEKLAPKVVAAENVRATLALVESGAADAAVVYATDAKVAKKAALAFLVPEKDDPGVSYVAVVVKSGDAAREALAAEYVKSLLSGPFQDAAAELGFLPRK